MNPGAPRGRLLVVDDDAELRGLLAEVLGEAGFSVVEACNGKEALAVLRSEPAPDAILLDLMMPVMDGWEFRAAQKLEPHLAATPVVVMTADMSPQAQTVDAALLVKKPFDLRTLLEGVDRVLDGAERRRLSEQLAHAERLASLGTLAAGIAHEINNPLAVVVGNLMKAMVELDSSTEPANIREHLDDALEAANIIRRIVREVGSFARQDAPQMPLDPRTSLNAALGMLGSELRRRARVVSQHEDIPAVVADEGRLTQVFVNLLQNAAHAMPETAEVGEIHTRSYRAASGEAIIEISDTGCGIPPGLLESIFDPFFTTKPPGQGTGLGLSIATSIVHALHGRIEVESLVGKGTTFRVHLPAAPEPSQSLAEAPGSSTPEPESALRRAHILVVDDEPRVADVLVMLLGDDHDVEVVTSGRAALDRLLGEVSYDAVLCDLNLRDLPSWTLYDKISAQRPTLARRIIFMTGGAYTPRSRELLARAPNPCLEKPFVQSDVERELSRVLARA
jgi:signal transduction histidine kinase